MSAAVEPREPAPRVAHYMFLVLAALLVVGSFLISRRPVLLANSPDVAPVAIVPLRAEPDGVRPYISAFGYHVPKTAWRASASAAPDTRSLRIGYSVRQVTFLTLPMFAYPEAGYVLYLDEGWANGLAPLGKDGLADLEHKAGAPLAQGWIFPVWRYAWGWLFPLAIALFFWRERRWQAERRAMLGLI